MISSPHSPLRWDSWHLAMDCSRLLQAQSWKIAWHSRKANILADTRASYSGLSSSFEFLSDSLFNLPKSLYVVYLMGLTSGCKPSLEIVI